jgi:DNA end-binding protein Ku
LHKTYDEEIGSIPGEAGQLLLAWRRLLRLPGISGFNPGDEPSPVPQLNVVTVGQIVVGKGEYLELDPEELEAIAIESRRTIEIDEFVPRKEIDELYLNSPYYIVPDGEVGQQAFAVIREAIRQEGMVAIGKVVFTSREHIIALEARDKGLLGVTLRYPYEVRKEAEYFDDIPDEKIPKDMLDLASHIVESKAGHFEPERFEDQYEDALKELLKKKQSGQKIEAPREREPSKVVNLMDALRRSVEAGGERRKPAPRAGDHRAPKKAGRSSARAKKAS